MKPGPRFKEILEEIQTEQLENRLATREQAMAYLEALLGRTADHPTPDTEKG